MYKSAVEVNHVPLDLMCYPPPYFNMPDNEKYKYYAFSPHGERYNEYEHMLKYFMEQDLVPLEKKTNWGGPYYTNLFRKNAVIWGKIS